jgi:hypothetical protein
VTIPPKKPGLRRFGTFLELLGAALIVGGIVTSAIAGVLAFRSTEILSHEQAGLFMAKVFERVFDLEIVGAILVALGIPFWRRPRGVANWAFLLVALAIFGQDRIARRMRVLRADAGGAIDRIAEDDPRRQEFRRLHGAYEGVSLAALAGGLLVLGANARKVA